MIKPSVRLNPHVPAEIFETSTKPDQEIVYARNHFAILNTCQGIPNLQHRGRSWLLRDVGTRVFLRWARCKSMFSTYSPISLAYPFPSPSTHAAQHLVADLSAALVVADSLRFLFKSAYSPETMQHKAQQEGDILIVSSTLKIKQLASVAACIALTLTKLGSHTKASMLSLTPSLSKSTPAQTLPLRCSTRRRLRISVASKPALSHSWRGMISRALAKDFMMACCLWGMFLSA